MKKLLLSLLLIGSVPLHAQLKTAEDYFNSALKYDANHEIKTALELYSKAIELDPIFTEAYIKRGLFKEIQRKL